MKRFLCWEYQQYKSFDAKVREKSRSFASSVLHLCNKVANDSEENMDRLMTLAAVIAAETDPTTPECETWEWYDYIAKLFDELVDLLMAHGNRRILYHLIAEYHEWRHYAALCIPMDCKRKERKEDERA